VFSAGTKDVFVTYPAERSVNLSSTALTSGRVPYATTDGLLTNSANLTFDGTTLTANTIGAFTLSGTVAGGGNQINNVVIGTSTPLAGTFSSLTDTGNLTFTGTGNRITGDFTNATVTNRASFQTSTANSTTGIYALPSGSSTAASWQATNAADPTNASKVLIATNGSTDVQLVSGVNGTGTYLPLSIFNGGSGRFVFGTSGQFGIGPVATVSYGTSGQVLTSGGASAAPTWSTPSGVTTGKSIAMAMIFGF
jgi:hypothetical protein